MTLASVRGSPRIPSPPLAGGVIRVNRGRLEAENLAGGEGRDGDVYELSDLLAKAMAVLDPETRSLMWLKEGEGLSLKELSETFKLPEGTLKSRLSRARERVREYLEKEAEVGRG